MTAAASKKKTGARKSNTAPGETIRSVVEALFKEGATNEQALEAVQKKFPQAKTSANSIRWYRNKLREKSAKVPGSRDAARKQDKKEAKDKGGDKSKGKGKAGDKNKDMFA